MAFARTTRCDAQPTPRSSTTSQIPPDVLRSANSAIGASSGGGRILDVTLLAQGGYNRVWLVTVCSPPDPSRPRFSHQPDDPSPCVRAAETDGDEGREARKFCLRMPMEDSLLPHQIWNEVAFGKFIAGSNLAIPVPQCFAFNDGTDSAPAFTAVEYVDGRPLSAVWSSYTSEEKELVARKIAEIIVQLGSVTFDGIGGLTLEQQPGPTVEGSKIFKGRRKFHSPSCYNIGPYASTKEYAISYYDKEIYYYSHASTEDIDSDLFDEVPVEEFVQSLRRKRQALVDDEIAFSPEEPFVLVHGDLHGRNIMMRGTEIAAVLDWEFAGAYPLSELLGGETVDVLEAVDEASEEENDAWGDRILELVRDVAESKGWSKEKVGLLLGGGNRELQAARVEMFP